VTVRQDGGEDDDEVGRMMARLGMCKAGVAHARLNDDATSLVHIHDGNDNTTEEDKRSANDGEFREVWRMAGDARWHGQTADGKANDNGFSCCNARA
jgi:hypothetical protein